MNLFKIFGLVALNGADAVRKELGDTTGSAEGASGKMSAAFKKIGTAVATYFAADKIISFGKGCIEAAADASAMEAQFSSVFGDMESQASKSLSNIAKNAGVSQNRMKGSFTKIAAFAKTTGMDTESALGLTERAMVAVADSAAFYDRSLEDTTESLQSFLKGNFENDAALGLSCTETTRNAAANKLYGKSFNELSESQKQLTLLQMVEDANAASGALGQAARESETWSNVTGNLKQSWTDFQAVLGEPILGIATKAVGWLSEKIGNLTAKFKNGTNPVQWFIDKLSALKGWLSDIAAYAAETFEPVLSSLETAWTNVKDAVQPLIDKLVEYVTNGGLAKDATDTVKAAIDLLAEAAGFVIEALKGFSDWCMEHKTTVETIAIVVGSFAAAWALVNGAMKVWQTVGLICTAITTGFGAAVQFLTSPVTLVIIAIGALIAIGVLLYKNWDTIKEKALELWNQVSTYFSQLWSDISTACSNIWTSVTTWFTSTKDAIVQKAQEIWTAVSTKFTEIWSSISSVCSNIFTTISSRFSTVKTVIQNTFDGIKSIWENSLKPAFEGIITFIKGVFTGNWSAAWSGIKQYVTSIWEGIKIAVSTAITNVRTIVVTTFNTLKGTVSTIWNNIKSAIQTPIEEAKTFVGNMIDKIKKFFDFEWSLPKLKMPHISITGSFSLSPPSVPKFGIEWYKAGGILEEPSIFGINPSNGKAMVGGEAGPEAVAPIDVLMGYVRTAVAEQNAAHTERIGAKLDEVTEVMQEMLAALREGHTIVLNNREFGRAVREYA